MNLKFSQQQICNSLNSGLRLAIDNLVVHKIKEVQ